MLNFLICLFLLLFVTLYICTIFDTTFGKAVPFSFVMVVLLQYLSAILGKLSYFKYVLVLAFILMMIHLIVLKKFYNRKLNIKKYINISFVVFVLFFIYNYINLSNVYYSNMDDLGYWGTRLDDMFRTDALYTIDSYVAYGGKGYPPFTHLLEFGICKLLGNLSEGNTIFALSTFTFSLFMPLFDKYELNNKKDIVKSSILFFGVIILLLCISLNPTNNNPSYVFNSIYVDWLLAIALMYGFYFVYTFDYDKLIDYASMSLVMFVLIFTKQIGIALVMLIFVTILIKHIIDKKYKQIIKLIIFTIIPFCIYASDNYFASYILSGNGVIKDNVSQIPVGSNFITGGLFSKNGIQQIVDFFIFILKEPVMKNPIKLSYFVIVIAIFVILIVFGIKNNERKSYYVIPIFYLLGSIGYALGIELSYISIFSDGYSYPLFGRYMQTYTYFGLALVVVLLYDKIKDAKYMGVLLIINCLFVNLDSVGTIIYSKDRVMYREKERAIMSEWIQNEYNYQKTLVINQTDMRYYNLIRKLFGEKGENVTYKQFTKYDDLDTLIELLNENEYLIIGDSNDYFNNLWSSVTELPIYNSTLYKIVKDENISLEMMYIWEE